MRLEFVEYQVVDAGIVMHFRSPDPGKEQANDVFVRVMDDEVTGDASVDMDLISEKLARKIKSSGVSSRLDGLIGMKVVLDKDAETQVDAAEVLK